MAETVPIKRSLPRRRNAYMLANLSLVLAYLSLQRAVAVLTIAHLLKITVTFEFAMLTIAIPGLRLRK